MDREHHGRFWQIEVGPDHIIKLFHELVIGGESEAVGAAGNPEHGVPKLRRSLRRRRATAIRRQGASIEARM